MIAHGSTRTVYLVGPYAFKVPTWKQWRLFLMGLLANMQESRLKGRNLCPVLFSLPGGWLVVMPRVNELTPREFERYCTEHPDLGPAEFKRDSFGMLDGKIVAIDYGN